MAVQIRKQMAQLMVQHLGSSTAEDPLSALIPPADSDVGDNDVGDSDQFMLLQHGLLGKRTHATIFLIIISSHCNRPSVPYGQDLLTVFMLPGQMLLTVSRLQRTDNSRLPGGRALFPSMTCTSADLR